MALAFTILLSPISSLPQHVAGAISFLHHHIVDIRNAFLENNDVRKMAAYLDLASGNAYEDSFATMWSCQVYTWR